VYDPGLAGQETFLRYKGKMWEICGKMWKVYLSTKILYFFMFVYKKGDFYEKKRLKSGPVSKIKN
jgi:hypothetical protein